MIVIKIQGGLGNQLQQYALGVKLKSLGKDVKYDIATYLGNDYGITHRELEINRFANTHMDIASEDEISGILARNFLLNRMLCKLLHKNQPYYLEKSMYDESIYCMDDVYLEGYFACEKYYADILPVLREELIFDNKFNLLTKQYAEKMLGENSVFIHVRRGDYLQEENAKLFGGICTEEYYDKAEEYIESHISNPHFYVFSDDIEYVSERYGSNDKYTVVHCNIDEDSIYDMYLMSCCRAGICANSTFSFWGARLSRRDDKIMIRPLKQRNNMEYIPSKIHKLWVDWVLIDELGKLV